MQIKVPFSKACLTGDELKYIAEVLNSGEVSGNGPLSKRVEYLLEQQLGADSVLLTTSCTHALEMAAILLDLRPGDEVIVPSFTFVSTALAFVMHGATPVYADIRNDTQNIDETKLESLITENTRAIVPVHYAGVACEMDMIMQIAQKHNLVVIEDNAHGLYGKYKERYLGTIGHMATQSFHGTKNFICGEGGALIINDEKYKERAEIVREKGTNRSRFLNGQVDKYSWVDKGSSYVISDVLAGFLYGQLLHADEIQGKRKITWEHYYDRLEKWAKDNKVRLPVVPGHCAQAYHMFYLVMPSIDSRAYLIKKLKDANISAVFHYQPLHNSEEGRIVGRTTHKCPVTQDTSDCLVRLPFFNDLDAEMQNYVINEISTVTFS